MGVENEKSGEAGTPRSSKYNAWGHRGCKLDVGNSKSEIEWIIYSKKSIPGPGEYGAPTLPGIKGGVISQARVPSELEWITMRAKRCPGPADYSPRVQDSSLNRGRFNLANPKSDLEWTIHFAKQLPGAYPTIYSRPRLGMNAHDG